MSNLTDYKHLYQKQADDERLRTDFVHLEVVPFDYEAFGYKLYLPKDWGVQTSAPSPEFKNNALIPWGIYPSPSFDDSRAIISVSIMNVPYSLSLNDWAGWYINQVYGTVIEQSEGKIRREGESEEIKFADWLMEAPETPEPIIARCRAFASSTIFTLAIGSALRSRYMDAAVEIETSLSSFQLLKAGGGDAELLDPFTDSASGLRFDFPQSWHPSFCVFSTPMTPSAVLTLETDKGIEGKMRIDGVHSTRRSFKDAHEALQQISKRWLNAGYDLENLTVPQIAPDGWQESSALMRKDGIENSLICAVNKVGDYWFSLNVVTPTFMDNPPAWMRGKRALEIVRKNLTIG